MADVNSLNKHNLPEVITFANQPRRDNRRYVNEKGQNSSRQSLITDRALGKFSDPDHRGANFKPPRISPLTKTKKSLLKQLLEVYQESIHNLHTHTKKKKEEDINFKRSTKRTGWTPN